MHPARRPAQRSRTNPHRAQRRCPTASASTAMPPTPIVGTQDLASGPIAQPPTPTRPQRPHGPTPTYPSKNRRVQQRRTHSHGEQSVAAITASTRSLPASAAKSHSLPLPPRRAKRRRSIRRVSYGLAPHFLAQALSAPLSPASSLFQPNAPSPSPHARTHLRHACSRACIRACGFPPSFPWTRSAVST